MKNEAVQIVSSVWGDAFNNRDGETFARMHSENVIFHDPTLPKPISGRTELEGWFDSLFKMFPDCRMEITRVYGLEDWVCAECIESGTMKGPIKHTGGEVPATGKPYRISNVLVCRLDGGKIAEVRSFYDALDLMAQLGLKP